jgi:hypothetical protein
VKAQILDADALRAITPSALAAYARSRSWRRTEPYGQHADVYVSPRDDEALIPRTDRLGDYAAAVSSVIGAFAKEADTDEFSIYRDVLGADHDVVRVRAVVDDDDGSIPIDAGVEIVRQSRDMLLAAACSIHNPLPYYRAGANRDATDYMRSVKLGQTEIGSFVVTLLAPVPPLLSPQQPTLDPSWAGLDDEPWERLVTRRLVKALTASRNATEASVSEQSAFEKAVEHGVSANLCEALAGLVEQSQETEISVAWAKTRPEAEPRSRIVFSRKDGAILKEAARTFRLRQAKENETLFGKVTDLHRGTTEIDGKVTLKALIEGKLQSVTALLDSSTYSKVLLAHDRKLPVVVRGDLRRIGQRWSLEQARLVEIVDSADDS